VSNRRGRDPRPALVVTLGKAARASSRSAIAGVPTHCVRDCAMPTAPHFFLVLQDARALLYRPKVIALLVL